MKPDQAAQRLDELWDELQRGRIWECSLRSDTFQMLGLQMGPNVYIDPRTCILEVVLHELLHRLKPRWGERKVEREANLLMRDMSEADKRKWWVAYKKIRRIGKPVDVEED